MRARHLIGRKIVAVDFRRFRTTMPGAPQGCEEKWATDPVLTLDNGRRLSFVVQETEVGEYGVELCLSKRPVDPGDTTVAVTAPVGGGKDAL